MYVCYAQCAYAKDKFISKSVCCFCRKNRISHKNIFKSSEKKDEKERRHKKKLDGCATASTFLLFASRCFCWLFFFFSFSFATSENFCSEKILSMSTDINVIRCKIKDWKIETIFFRSPVFVINVRLCAQCIHVTSLHFTGAQCCWRRCRARQTLLCVHLCALVSALKPL